MSSTSPDLAVIGTAIERVASVRGVSALHAFDRRGEPVIVARIELSPRLKLTQIVVIISEVDLAVRHADPRVRSVFIEPDVAADAATPTETIVIRALD